MYKILTKASSFLERSITFSVDGKLETVSAPAATATFDDLILRIEQKYGGDKPKNEEKTVTIKAETATAQDKPKTSRKKKAD